MQYDDWSSITIHVAMDNNVVVQEIGQYYRNKSCIFIFLTKYKYAIQENCDKTLYIHWFIYKIHFVGLHIIFKLEYTFSPHHLFPQMFILFGTTHRIS